jgi:glycine/serine hydroxymethyltransferase
MHIIAAKQLRLVKRYKMNSLRTLQLQKNAKAMAEALKEGTISFQEVQTTMMLIDLRNKGISGKKLKMH